MTKVVEFARFKRRSPALIGQGHRARIWVERAEFDLQRSLDVSE